jgi:hypothetical protein
VSTSYISRAGAARTKSAPDGVLAALRRSGYCHADPRSRRHMASFWTLLNERALSVSVAQGAFNFEISWFGILLIVGAMLLWRYLRRR